MRVGVVGGAVGGPAGVADAGRGRRERGVGERLLEVGELAGPLLRGDAAVVDQRDPGRVVAAVLQPAEPLDHDVLGLLRSRRIRRFRTWARVYRRLVPTAATLPARAGAPATVPGMPARPRRNGGDRESSPYVELDRDAWAALGAATEQPLTRGRDRAGPRLGDELDLDEVAAGLPAALAAAQPVRRERQRPPPGRRRSSSTSRTRPARRS